MPLVCPDCDEPTLEVHETLELPPDSRSDEITLQIVECSACGFRAAASYEESRRGGLDEESVDHSGYRLPADRLDLIAALIGVCPEPDNARCTCASHQELGARDPNGRWVGIGRDGWFAVKYVS